MWKRGTQKKIADEKTLAGQVNPEEGSLVFAVQRGTGQWNDGLMHLLVDISNPQVDISIRKDPLGRLMFTHLLFDRGSTTVGAIVSNLSRETGHVFIASWSLKNKEIALYIDGERVASTRISYGTERAEEVAVESAIIAEEAPIAEVEAVEAAEEAVEHEEIAEAEEGETSGEDEY